MSRTLPALLMVLTLTLSPTLATAQDGEGAGGTPAALNAGTFGLSLGLAGGNPYANNTANLSYFFTSRLNFGLSLGVRIEDGDDELAGFNAGPGSGEWGIALAPMLRYYFPRGHAVVPYAFGKLNFVAADQGPLEDYLSLEGGLGAEWFPYDYFSIGGAIGLNLNLVNDFGLGLFTSALLLNFYF